MIFCFLKDKRGNPLMTRFSNGKIKNLSKDFIYNIVASIILTGIMQIVVYPFLASKLTGDAYGTLLTTMGIINTIIVSLGNTLNNVRLIMNSNYVKDNENGDFQIILFASEALGIIASLIVTIFVFKLKIVQTVLLCLVVILGLAKSYYCVSFRLQLNFKLILLQNVFGAIGYGLGIVVFFVLHEWPIPFLFAELSQLIFVICVSSLWREPFAKTKRFATCTSKYFILILTGLSSSLILYLDRIIIYPLIDGEAVSIYTIASVFGKSLGIIMTPIAGVLLSYYAQIDFVMTVRRFRKTNIISLIFGAFFIVCTIFISPIVTKLLYPSFYDQVSPFLFVANLAATINVIGNLTQSAVLKYAPTWLQIIKEAIYCLTYVLLGLLLLKPYGLFGFCIASIVANSVKLLSLYIIGEFFIRRLKTNDGVSNE